MPEMITNQAIGVPVNQVNQRGPLKRPRLHSRKVCSTIISTMPSEP